MNTIHKMITAAAATGLMFGTMTVAADDTTTTSTIDQPVAASSGGYSTDATDRGGRPAAPGETQTTISILDWLKGLMD